MRRSHHDVIVMNVTFKKIYYLFKISQFKYLNLINQLDGQKWNLFLEHHNFFNKYSIDHVDNVLKTQVFPL